MKLTKRDLSDLVDLLSITQDWLDRELATITKSKGKMPASAEVNHRDRAKSERLIKKLKAEMKT